MTHLPVVLALLAAPISAKGGQPPSGYLGRWVAVVPSNLGSLRSVDLFDWEISQGPQGLLFRDRGRIPMAGAAAPVVVTDSGTIRASWKLAILPTSLWFEGRLVDGALQGSVGGLGVTGQGVIPLRLVRPDSGTRRYFAARVDERGQRAGGYRYRRPDQVPGDFPVATAAEAGVDRARLEALVRDILAEGDSVGDRHTDGVLVLRHGKVVFEEYFWGWARDLAHPIASITKSVASLLVGIAADSGKLAIDELVAAQFPERSNRWIREGYPIRIRDLLSMTGGLRWTDRSAADAYTQRFFETPDQIGFVLDLESVDPPGLRYNYNNGLPALLGPILAKRTGERLATYADRVLFGRLGIRNYSWAVLRDGTPLLAGGLRMSLRDMARLGQLVLDHGRWKGRQVVSADWIAQSTARQTPPTEYPYGFYWHLSDPENPWRGQPPSYLGPIDRFRAVMAIGQAGQAVVVLPEADAVIAVVSSNWQPGMGKAYPTEIINRYLVPAIETGPRARR